MLKAAAKNDARGVAKGLLKGVAATGQVWSSEGKDEARDQFSKGWSLGDSKDVKDGKVETKSSSEATAALADKVQEGIMDLYEEFHDRFFPEDEEGKPQAYKVVRKQTAWISHGAGGTHAITYDVQQAVQLAYGKALDKLAAELSMLSTSKSLGKGALLEEIISAPMKRDATMHPVTAWVIRAALAHLESGSGSQYQALTGGSGMFGRASVLAEAKAAVKRSYGLMLDGSSGMLVSSEVLAGRVFPKK